MGKYFETVSGVAHDELVAGTEYPVEVWNVSCASTASLERGDLICASSMSGVWSVVGGASDATKCLAICAASNEGATVTQAYAAGTFNRERVTFGGNSALTTTPFEQSLRTQNIHLRTLAEKF